MQQPVVSLLPVRAGDTPPFLGTATRLVYPNGDPVIISRLAESKNCFGHELTAASRPTSNTTHMCMPQSVEEADGKFVASHSHPFLALTKCNRRDSGYSKLDSKLIASLCSCVERHWAVANLLLLVASMDAYSCPRSVRWYYPSAPYRQGSRFLDRLVKQYYYP